MRKEIQKRGRKLIILVLFVKLHEIRFDCETGVSGQFYALLGDKEKVFAPMRFLGFNIYLHDKGQQPYYCKSGNAISGNSMLINFIFEKFEVILC